MDAPSQASHNFPAGLKLTPSTLPTTGFLPSPAAIDEERWIERYGIAGRIWEASHLLGLYLNPPDSLRVNFDPPCPIKVDDTDNDFVVLELGSGTGVVGLQIARLLPPSALIFLTDLKEVCPLLEQNAARVRAWTDAADIEVRPLAWGSRYDAACISEKISQLAPRAASDGTLKKRRLTHIVCSDLVYFPDLFAPLLSTLLYLTSPEFNRDNLEPAQIVIAYQTRTINKEQPFWDAFGYWFHFTPVLLHPKDIAIMSLYPYFNGPIPRTLGLQFSILPTVGSRLSGTYIFIATRKPERIHEMVPPEQYLLGYKDSFFETMLAMNTAGIL